jgi:hypothetical protein
MVTGMQTGQECPEKSEGSLQGNAPCAIYGNRDRNSGQHPRKTRRA